MPNEPCEKCHLRPHSWFTNEGYLCNECNDDRERREAEAAHARRIETFRRALMESHADRWTTEDIAEAAHICARAESGSSVSDVPDRSDSVPLGPARSDNSERKTD